MAPPPPQIEGMIQLAGSSSMMGSTQEEIDAAFNACTRLERDCRQEVYEREQPRRRVTVRAFYLDETEVTNQRYARWLNIKSIDHTVKGGRSVATSDFAARCLPIPQRKIPDDRASY